MLKTPQLVTGDPVLALIAECGGRKDTVKVLEEGAVEIGHFSGDALIWGRNSPELYMSYPEISGVAPYGVCDTPKQFLDENRSLLIKDPRTFLVTFTHIVKDPSNRGKGGGWRWHKWGPYIGVGRPTYEYLDDEDDFDAGVYVYHIYQIAGPEIKLQGKW